MSYATFHDLMVTCTPHQPAAQQCSECHAQLATVRVAAHRVERGGQLVTDRERSVCGGCVEKVAETLRAGCRWRLYQGKAV